MAPKSQRDGSSLALEHEIPAASVTDAKRWVEDPHPKKGFRGPQMKMHLRGWKTGSRKQISLFVLEGGTSEDREKCYGLIEHRVKTVWSKQGGARRVVAKRGKQSTAPSKPGTYVSMRAQIRYTGPSAVLKKALFGAIKDTSVRFDLLGRKDGSPELSEYTLSGGTKTEREAVAEQVTVLSDAFSTTYEVLASVAGGALKRAQKQFVKATGIQFDYMKCGWTDESKKTTLYCVIGLCPGDREAFADDVDYFAHEIAEETAELVKRYLAGATVKVTWDILKGHRGWKQRYTTHYFRPEKIPKEDWTTEEGWTVASVAVEQGKAFVKKVKDLMVRAKEAKKTGRTAHTTGGGAAEVVRAPRTQMTLEDYDAKQKVLRDARNEAKMASIEAERSPPPAESEDDEEPSVQTGGGYDALGAIDPDRTGDTVRPSKRALKRKAKQEAADEEAVELASQQEVAEELIQTLTKKGKALVPKSELTFTRGVKQETAEDRQRKRLADSKKKIEADKARDDIAAVHSVAAATAKPQGGAWAAIAKTDPKEFEDEKKKLTPPRSFSSEKTVHELAVKRRAMTGVKRLEDAAKRTSFEIDNEVVSYHDEDREVPSGWDSDEE